MKYRSLGKTGLMVSEISLGSWTTYGGSVGAKEATRIIRHAFDKGINLFDTADVYVRGAAESVLGRALRGLPREQLVIATKCMGRVWDGPLGAGLSRKHIFDALHQSLTRLKVDYIDLYQLHAPDKTTPIEETLEAMEDLVRMGKVRYIGFSNFDHQPPLLRRAVAHQKRRAWSPFISSQPRWNLLDRHVEKEHVAFCRKNGIGMIIYSPLAQGVLTNKYAGGKRPKDSRARSRFKHFLESEKALTAANMQAVERLAAWVKRKKLPSTTQVALAWLLSRSQVSSAIVGATKVKQLNENLKAVELKLSASEWKEAERAVRGTTAGRRARR
jgi:aryl-alcohol dehydrogenase-like predicted oxidoreductase